MSLNYQLIKDGDAVTAVLRNIEIPENVNSIGYSTSFYQRGSEMTLLFDTCIISSISEIFANTSRQVTKIEVRNSIIDRLELKNLKKFENLTDFFVVNSSLNELTGTFFEGMKDFALKFDNNEASAEFAATIVSGKISMVESKQEEEAEEQASGSTGILSSTVNARPVKARKFKKAVHFLPSSPPGVSPFGLEPPGPAHAQSQGLFGQSHNLHTSLFGPPVCTFPTQSDQSTAAKRSCDQSPLKIADNRANWKERYTKSQTINANLSKDLEVLRDQVMKLERKSKEFGLLADLKKIFHDETFKDFTVNVNNEKSFKIHKLLFAARSSVIANIIRNNPEEFELNLEDIPLPIFKILLYFVYNDAVPEMDENLIGTYAAAGRLDIKDLKNLTARKLMDKIDDKNAFKILELSNKYGNDELRLKAFEEIKKILSDYKMSDEFSKKPEKIMKLLEMKKKMDEEYAKMQQEFEEVQNASDDQQEVAEGNSDSYEIVD